MIDELRDKFRDWSGGTPIVSLWCRWKGHREGPWRDTYQPHTEKQECRRCGAFRLRPKARPW
jgi:hypothetical protein